MYLGEPCEKPAIFAVPFWGPGEAWGERFPLSPVLYPSPGGVIIFGTYVVARRVNFLITLQYINFKAGALEMGLSLLKRPCYKRARLRELFSGASRRSGGHMRRRLLGKHWANSVVTSVRVTSERACGRCSAKPSFQDSCAFRAGCHGGFAIGQAGSDTAFTGQTPGKQRSYKRLLRASERAGAAQRSFPF